MPPVRSPLPLGFRLQVDLRTRCSEAGQVIDGGSPWRMLRLSSRGADVAARLLAGSPVADEHDGLLARRLAEAGLAHPMPPASAAPPVSLLVVVPVRDRVGQLDVCLGSLTPLPVVVVDDGSRDAAAVEDVCRRHGAQLVTRAASGGPAAARNSGVAAGDAEVIAFVDSDCRADASALRLLARHLADPVAAAVAPRVLRDVGDAGADRSQHGSRRGPLDMGEQPATVSPGARVSYVPSTALVVRRDALTHVGGFDESLRYGEDVDLCWRLHAAGWAIRYDPRVAVRHVEPDSWTASLGRRFRYGTSAGPLARRHPGALRGPSLRGLVAPVTLLRAQPGGGSAVPPEVLRRVARTAPVSTAAGLVRWATPMWCPPAAALRGDPSHLLSAVADEAAYGVGVWWGCLRARTLEPVLPAVSERRQTSSP